MDKEKKSDVVAKEPRFLKVTASLRLDKGFSEKKAIEGIKKLEKSLIGSAYILHDEDVYMLSDIEAAMSEAPPDESVTIELGSPKPPHIHLLLAFKNQMRLSTLCSAFGVDEKYKNLFQKVNGNKGYINMLAYLTHITPMARAEEKCEYPPESVKMLIFPKFKGTDAFDGVKNYAQFAEKYATGEITADSICLRVMRGQLDLDDVKKKHPEYYLDNIRKLTTARQEYIKTLPMPKTLCNFYIGPYDDYDGNKGGIGKSYLSELLAVSQLRLIFPNVKDEDFTEEFFRKHVLHAGATGVSLDSYSGQEVIIWNDTRAYTLIKTFGGIEQLFNALDLHPKPHDFNIKYGKVQLRNSVNIFDGIQSFNEFRDELSKRYKDDGFVVNEDKTQATRRFPFFIEVSPETITCHAEMRYLVNNGFSIAQRYHNSVLEVRGNKDKVTQSNFLQDFYAPVRAEIAADEEKYGTLPKDIFKQMPDNGAGPARQMRKRHSDILDEDVYDISGQITWGDLGYMRELEHREDAALENSLDEEELPFV